MSDVVRDTEIRMKAAYKAIIREHLPIIREMRQRTRSKAWNKISDAIFSLDSKRIPSSQIGKLVSEVEAELSAERAAPLVMTHFQNERVSEETQEAYKKAGYDDVRSAGAQSNATVNSTRQNENPAQ